ncbi:MAG: hypothetical protein O9327_05860 [Polaromonas sp.]|nr:hypothetical protein [Polaromonas sp.]
MGEISDEHVNNFASGRWGIPLPKVREYPTTTRAAIAGQRFSIVEVIGGKTNRVPGMRLVVCEHDEANYWVWASSGVTGIAKVVCKVLESDLPLNAALAKTGRKSYGASPREDQVEPGRRMQP